MTEIDEGFHTTENKTIIRQEQTITRQEQTITRQEQTITRQEQTIREIKYFVWLTIYAF